MTRGRQVAEAERRRELGIASTETRPGSVRVRIAMRGRAAQPHAWHTLAHPGGMTAREARWLISILRAGCEALDVPLRVLDRRTGQVPGERPPGPCARPDRV